MQRNYKLRIFFFFSPTFEFSGSFGTVRALGNQLSELPGEVWFTQPAAAPGHKWPERQWLKGSKSSAPIFFSWDNWVTHLHRLWTVLSPSWRPYVCLYHCNCFGQIWLCFYIADNKANNLLISWWDFPYLSVWLSTGVHVLVSLEMFRWLKSYGSWKHGLGDLRVFYFTCRRGLLSWMLNGKSLNRFNIWWFLALVSSACHPSSPVDNFLVFDFVCI